MQRPGEPDGEAEEQTDVELAAGVARPPPTQPAVIASPQNLIEFLAARTCPLFADEIFIESRGLSPWVAIDVARAAREAEFRFFRLEPYVLSCRWSEGRGRWATFGDRSSFDSRLVD